MNWPNILNGIIQSLFTILITFLMFYLAGLLKKRFGKDISDKYLKAANIAVKITEQTYKKSTDISNAEKKKMAMNIAREILNKENENKIDDKLLDRTIEASVYEIGRKK